ncbi:PadR family transcriptional regulator [Tumebacillus sp. DT12]|uniref:PadR family transcriptional regulator n=1 Tax=Tumebacillus lacus TaxID=2995335 RepID=A0ABT3X2P0_9BACL|nr:PadR family transcriptional regulator [Tumebacillus lacus]MCX7571186.1 PadR family transcriptional regulator [Tumebacillus lacus]
MALRYAVLGLLSKAEMSGYDLTQRFTQEVSHFWNAHHTQIYRELQKLEDEGLLHHQVVEQSDRPDKKIYSLTDAGLEALLTWLSESPKPPKMKNESLLRVSLFHLIPPERAIAFLEESKRAHQEIISLMNLWKQEHFPDDHPVPQEIGEYLTIEYGTRFVQTWIDWCEFAIGVFSKLR